MWRCWIWSFMISVRIVSALYIILEKFSIYRMLLKELLRKRTLIIVKAIPWIPEPALLSLSVNILDKSCWVLLYSGFVDPCCRWASWADLFWIVLHDYRSFRRWEVKCVILGQDVYFVCYVYVNYATPLLLWFVIIIELSL